MPRRRVAGGDRGRDADAHARMASKSRWPASSGGVSRSIAHRSWRPRRPRRGAGRRSPRRSRRWRRACSRRRPGCGGSCGPSGRVTATPIPARVQILPSSEQAHAERLVARTYRVDRIRILPGLHARGEDPRATGSGEVAVPAITPRGRPAAAPGRGARVAGDLIGWNAARVAAGHPAAASEWLGYDVRLNSRSVSISVVPARRMDESQHHPRRSTTCESWCLIKANEQSEAGEMPSERLLTEMTAFNEELVKAGVMLAGEGLHPSSKGARVRFAGEQAHRHRRPVRRDEGAASPATGCGR